MISTPLRYPGGKSRAIKTLKNYLPQNIKEFREPFVGGGSFFLWYKQQHPECKIWINDVYYNLYCFWQQLQDRGEEMVEVLHELKIIHHEEESDLKMSVRPKERTKKAEDLFFKCKELIQYTDDPFWIAICFWILNKCSFAGLTETGSFSPQASISNFSKGTIEKLLNISKLIQDVKITNVDYSRLLDYDAEDTFVFLDPPYDILTKSKSNALYGKDGSLHKQFNHEQFFTDVEHCNNKFMITYNSSLILKERYKDFKIIPYDLKYGMQYDTVINEDGSKGFKAHSKEELIIMNYEL